MYDFLNSAAGLVVALLTIGGILGGFFVRRVRPALSHREADRIAQRDAILGRPAIPDTTRPGHILHPATPGLPERMTVQEQFALEQRGRLDDMAGALLALAESHKHQGLQDERLDDLEVRVDDLETLEARVTELESASVERVVTKAESAAAWRAVEAVALAQPDQEADPTP